MSYLIAFIFYAFLFSSAASENKKILHSHKTEKVIFVGKASLPISNFTSILTKQNIAFDENDHYFLVYDLDFLNLIGIMSHNSPSFYSGGKANSYHWRCVKGIDFQKKISQEFIKSNIHHALFERGVNSLQAPPYCYMFYSDDRDKIRLLEKKIKESESITNNVLDEKQSNYIDYQISLEELIHCDTALVAEVLTTEDKNRQLVVKEILKDNSNRIKVGDLLSRYSYQGIMKDSDSGAFFCKRYNNNFLNFFDKEKNIPTSDGKISINNIRNFLISRKEKDGNKNNRGFILRKPYAINLSFSIKDMSYCDPLLVSTFSEHPRKSELIVSEVINDRSNSLSTGDFLTTIPFREALSSEFIGALFCRRQNIDFFNFFNKIEEVEPNKTSLVEVKKQIER